jgi:hypothetical protein
MATMHNVMCSCEEERLMGLLWPLQGLMAC